MQFESVDDILDFAISNEEKAFKFYTDLSLKMKNPHMQKVFDEFAGEEKKHREKLVAVKEGQLLVPSQEKITDLKISDYLLDVEEKPEMNYQEALILAMKKEKKAFQLYMDLHEAADNENAKNIFMLLAQEEAKHKLRLEIEYDEYILKED